MMTIIAGSREATKLHTWEAIQSCPWEITSVVSGTARGPDTHGILYAQWKRIPWMEFPADWDKHGKRAGILRNEEMAKHSEALIAVWDGVSRGTEHMIRCAKEHNLEIHVYKIKAGTS